MDLTFGSPLSQRGRLLQFSIQAEKQLLPLRACEWSTDDALPEWQKSPLRIASERSNNPVGIKQDTYTPALLSELL